MTDVDVLLPTVGLALREASARLTSAGVETPGLDARLLLAWTLKARREDLVREPERLLTEREQLIFDKALSLRVLRRPLPYITGEQWFYGRPFKINRAVLIPRPETEHLIEAVLELSREVDSPYFADIGTGSGCVAVTLAAERPDTRIWATDLSPDALNVARKNAVRHGVLDRITFLQGDLLLPLPIDFQFDVIVSNPPYIRADEIADLQPEVRDYEPSLALSGMPGATGTDGTLLHRRLLQDAPRFLKPGGWLLLEVGQGQAETVAGYARSHGYTEVVILNDLSSIGRVVQARA
jgi:release factor glutamine methyltransferase